MRRLASVAWLHVEHAPDLLMDLIPGALLAAGGLIVLGLALIR